MKLVETYFDRNSKFWSDVYLQPKYVGDLVLIARNDIAVRFLTSHLPEAASVLDAGCGAGLTTLALAKRGFFVHAMDISQKMLDSCQQNLDSAGIASDSYTLSQADVLEIELPEQSFDGIAALGFLQYQVDERNALTRLNTLLKPGGILVISGPVKVKLSDYFGLGKVYYALKESLKKTQPEQGSSLLHQISTHYYGVGRFKTLLKEAGFEMLDYKGHGFINFAILKDFTSRGQNFLHRFFTRLSDYLPIDRFANDMVVVAKKVESNR